MKQMIALVITITIVCMLALRFSKHRIVHHSGNKQPLLKDRRLNADLDLPITAGRLLIRHLLY